MNKDVREHLASSGVVAPPDLDVVVERVDPMTSGSLKNMVANSDDQGSV